MIIINNNHNNWSRRFTTVRRHEPVVREPAGHGTVVRHQPRAHQRRTQPRTEARRQVAPEGDHQHRRAARVAGQHGVFGQALRSGKYFTGGQKREKRARLGSRVETPWGEGRGVYGRGRVFFKKKQKKRPSIQTTSLTFPYVNLDLIFRRVRRVFRHELGPSSPFTSSDESLFGRECRFDEYVPLATLGRPSDLLVPFAARRTAFELEKYIYL